MTAPTREDLEALAAFWLEQVKGLPDREFPNGCAHQLKLCAADVLALLRAARPEPQAVAPSVGTATLREVGIRIGMDDYISATDLDYWSIDNVVAHVVWLLDRERKAPTEAPPASDTEEE